ncbi:MAG: Clp protease N-terminal domain-containing protein [Candidatus Methylacidiphilales bacterium]|nr:Clp protease N-terminal domain-containing protein [Candidatus Methylacidiphilales bacterium]
MHVHVWSASALRNTAVTPLHSMNPLNPMRVQPLSRRADLVLTIASRLAGSDSRAAIGPLDMLKATLGLGSGVAWYVLSKQGVHLEQGELILADLNAASQDPRPRQGMNRAATSAIYQAELETRMRNLTYVSVECLLFGVLSIEDAEVEHYLATFGTSIKAVRELLEPALLVS